MIKRVGTRVLPENLFNNLSKVRQYFEQNYIKHPYLNDGFLMKEAQGVKAELTLLDTRYLNLVTTKFDVIVDFNNNSMRVLKKPFLMKYSKFCEKVNKAVDKFLA